MTARPPMMRSAAPAAATRLDEFMPVWDHRTMHARPVDAPVDAVRRAIAETSLQDAWLARGLMAVRTLGGSLRADSDAPVGDMTDRLPGFLPLGTDNGETLVGYVGRPWPRAPRLPAVADVAAFRGAVPDDAVKVVMSVRCDTAAYGTLLLTETRIQVGPLARRPFGRYWRLVAPGSGLVRRSLLRAIARHAERSADAAD